MSETERDKLRRLSAAARKVIDDDLRSRRSRHPWWWGFDWDDLILLPFALGYVLIFVALLWRGSR